MSNNIIRKGLVAAALAGLAATAFTGTPALAADTVTTTSALGSASNFTGLFSSSFTLNTYASATGTVTYKITGVQAQYVSEKFSQSATATATAAAGTSGTEVLADGTAAAATDTTFYVVAQANDTTKYNKLTLTLSGTAATTAVTVTPWVDTILNKVVDPTETNGTATTVNFIKDSTVTATTAITAPVLGANSLSALVTLDQGVNLAQVAGSVSVNFLKDGSNAVAGHPLDADQTFPNGGAGVATAYSADDSALKATFNPYYSNTPALVDYTVVAATYSAQAKVNNVVSGLPSTATAAAGTVTASASATAGVFANGVDGFVAATGANVAKDVANADTTTNKYRIVRSGTSSVTLTDTLFKNTAGDAVAAGTVATVTVTKTAADATSVITAGGKTIAAAAANGSTTAISFNLTTDANGKISFDLGNSAGKDGDIVSVSVKSEGITGATTTVKWNDAAYALAANITAKSVAIGGTLANSWTVKDQFGVAPADGKYVVALSRAVNAARTTAAAFAYTVPVVSGVAAGSIVDNGAGVGSDTVTATLYPVLTGGGLGGAAGNTAFVLTYSVAADVTPASIAVTGDLDTDTAAANHALNLVDYVVTDGSANSPAAPTYANADALTVAVKQATGGQIAGIAVTVSAKGLAFAKAGKYTTDSISFTTTGGADVVNVYSNLAGKQAITVTAGAVTKVVYVTFAAAAAATGKTLVITAPATATPGSTVNFSAVLADKYGNPVAVVAPAAAGNPTITVKATGLGAATNATSSDATGTAAGYVTTGSADNGTITITATYNFDGTTASKTVTATASVKVAAAAAAKTALAVGADQAQVGAAVDVIATATDAAGKAAAGVVVTFDNVGQGYLSATSATTDANGVAKVKLVGNVAGRNTLTATANGATAANAGVSFGAADANITVKGKRATVTYEFAGLAKVVVSVNGTRQPAVYPADDNEGTYSFNLKAGTNKIVVSIAGKTVDSKTVKIKK